MNQGLQLRLPLLQATWQATAKMPRRLRAVAQGGDERPAAARRRPGEGPRGASGLVNCFVKFARSK